MYHKSLTFFYYFIKTTFPQWPVCAECVQRIGSMFFHSKCFTVQSQREVRSVPLQCGLIKQSQEDCCFSSLVTGKHKACCSQVRQDKLKNPQVVESLETRFRNSILFRSDTHTQTH